MFGQLYLDEGLVVAGLVPVEALLLLLVPLEGAGRDMAHEVHLQHGRMGGGLHTPGTLTCKVMNEKEDY